MEDFAKGDNFFFSSNFLILFAALLSYWAVSLFFGSIIDVLFGPFGSFSFLIVLSAICVYIFARIIINVYNRMVELNVRCENAKSQILIELKKRSDLVPLLEELSKGHARYEKSVLVALAFLRQSAISLVESKEGKKLVENDSSLRELVSSFEKYPSLNSNSNFKDFIFRLTQIENNIAYYRGFYNKTVTKYNILINLFPFVIISSVFRFKKKDLLVSSL